MNQRPTALLRALSSRARAAMALHLRPSHSPWLVKPPGFPRQGPARRAPAHGRIFVETLAPTPAMATAKAQ